MIPPMLNKIPHQVRDDTSAVILAIETCLTGCSACVYDGSKYHYLESDIINKQSESILLLIQDAMKQASLDFADINMLTCTKGPGGFTSLRVGLAAITGLQIATNLPVSGFSTLEVIAYKTTSSDKITATLNANRGQAYIQDFDVSGDVPIALTKAIACDSDALPTKYPLVGNIDYVDEMIIPNAKSLAELCLASEMKESNISPIYIRKAVG